MDPLDWTHQWDDYEMMMYVEPEGPEDGIYIQVSQKVQREGAEEWNVLYSRKLDVVPGILNPHEQGTLEWEDVFLRHYLHQNPNLVNDEKAFLNTFLME